MQISLADGLKDQIKRIAPYVRVSVVATEYGDAVKVEGKGAKTLVAYFARERFYNGETNTNWAGVMPRHGLGYIIPMYENPIASLAL